MGSSLSDSPLARNELLLPLVDRCGGGLTNRPLWSMRGSTVGAEVPFEGITATHFEPKRFPDTAIVTFSVRDGRHWRYELQKWEERRAALPATLLP